MGDIKANRPVVLHHVADEAIAFLKQANKVNQPIFVCLWTYNPHFPFEAPADLVKKYEGQVGPGLKRPVYGGQIEATDRAIGRVLDAFDKAGLADDTLVVFTSDNGGWEGATDNRPLRSGKGDLYEGGIRVPLIIRWPGVTKAKTIDATPVVTMDLTATILDAVGASVESPMDGVSLRSVMASGAAPDRSLYFHYPHFAWHRSNRPGAAIRSGSFKLIQRFDGGLELFDLEKDQGEKRNLAKQQPDRVAAMKRSLEEWLDKVGAQRPTLIRR